MFVKVSYKEIKDIRDRLKTELEDKDIQFQRKEEVISLIYHIDTWSDGMDYLERKHYRKVIKSES
jgi:phage FluMu gp28-like protein